MIRKLKAFALLVAAPGLLAVAGCGPEENEEKDGNGNGNEGEIELVEIERGPMEGPFDSDITLEAGIWQVGKVITVSKKLVIPAGSRLVFAADAGIKVAEGGSIEATGESRKPIIMEGQVGDPGFWLGLAFASRTPSNLDFVTIRHAGAGTNNGFNGRTESGISVADKAVLQLRDSRLELNKGAGVVLFNEAELRGFARNVFSNNDGAAVRLNAQQVGMLDEASNYGGDPEPNKENHVAVRSQTVSATTVWPSINVPYRVAGATVVDGTDTVLTIGAGNTLEFAADAGLKAGSGALKIVGKEDARITLKGTESQRGFWLGLAYYSKRTENAVSFVDLSDGGSGANNGFNGRTSSGVSVHPAAEVKLSDSTFSNNGGVGVRAFSGASLKGFARNAFHENEEFALHVDASVARYVDAESDFVGSPTNGLEGIRVTGEKVSGEQTWVAPGTAWFIEGIVNFDDSTGKMSIAAGNTFQFASNAGMKVVKGGLEVVGTSAEPVVFEGRDHSPGSWNGLAFASNSSANLLRHVTVREAGQGSDNGFNGRVATNVFVSSSARLALDTVRLEDSAGYGLYVASGGECEYDGVGLTFANNADSDVEDKNP